MAKFRYAGWLAVAFIGGNLVLSGGAVGARYANPLDCYLDYPRKPPGASFRSGTLPAGATYRPPRDAGDLTTSADRSPAQRRRGAIRRNAPALAAAKRFAGDEWVGRLRWAASQPYQDGTTVLNAERGRVAVATGAALPGQTIAGAVGVLRVRDGRLLWSRGSEGTVPSVTLIDSAVYLTEVESMGERGARALVVALDARTGTFRWCNTLARSEEQVYLPLLRPWYLSDGTLLGQVVLGEKISLVRARLSDGEILWRRQLPEEFGSEHSTLAVGDDVVVLSTYGHDSPRRAGRSRLLALRLRNGSTLWSSKRDTEIDMEGPHREGVTKSDWHPIPIGVRDGILIVAERRARRGHIPGQNKPGHGRVAAYDVRDGTLRWQRRVPEIGYRYSYAAHLVGSMVLINDVRVDDGQRSSRLSAIRVRDGSVAWTTALEDVPDLERITIEGGRAYLPRSSFVEDDRGDEEESGLTAVDLRSGEAGTTLDVLDEGTLLVSGVSADEGHLFVQYKNLTLAFGLPKRGSEGTSTSVSY